MIDVLVRGGGDLASGAVLRMARAGFRVLVTELPQPLAVRRTVSFAQAVYDGGISIESISAQLVATKEEADLCFRQNMVGVIVDPSCTCLEWFRADVIIDARMAKQYYRQEVRSGVLQVGLGPGFIVGENCDVVIETMRGPHLGRAIWDGAAEKDTGEPDSVRGFQAERVLRSPSAGEIQTHCKIGDHVDQGQVIAEIGGAVVIAPFSGMIRGLLQNGLKIVSGVKIGDLDPRDDPSLCFLVSDKALAVGGGVMDAIMSNPDLRRQINA